MTKNNNSEIEEITQAVLGYYKTADSREGNLIHGFSKLNPSKISGACKGIGLVWELKKKWGILGVKHQAAKEIWNLMVEKVKNRELPPRNNATMDTAFWSKIIVDICKELKKRGRYELSWVTKFFHWSYPEVLPAFDQYHFKTLKEKGFISGLNHHPRSEDEIKIWLDGFHEFANCHREILLNIISEINRLEDLPEQVKTFATIPFVADFYLWFMNNKKKRNEYVNLFLNENPVCCKCTQGKKILSQE